MTNANNTQKLRTVALCFGGGGLDEGLARVLPNATLSLIVEIEAYAVAIALGRVEVGDLPAVPIWTDLKTLRWDEVAGTFDVLTGGFPCFTAGHLVLTKHGHKPIEEIRIGDEVLTHTGRFRKVLSIMQKSGARNLHRITHGGQHGITTTSEHPFLTRKRYWEWNNSERQKVRKFEEPKWTDASGLSRDTFICDVVPTEEIDHEYSEGVWKLVGRYLADGYLHVQGYKHRTVFCIGKHKEAEFVEILNASGFAGCRSEERTSINFHVTNTEFTKWLRDNFGEHACGKYIPGWVFCLPRSKLNALWEGYMSGDGSKDKLKSVSVSEKLAYSMAMVWRIVNNRVPGVRKQHTADTCVIEGRTVNQRDYFVNDYPRHNKVAFVDGIHGFRQIRHNKTIETEGETVYNIEVEEDNSYTVNNIVVHNCQPFSAAGKRQGSDDPRHLWPYIVRGIETCKPKLCVFENVSGILSAKLGAGHGDPEGTPVALHVLRSLERLGYRATFAVSQADEAGHRHTRQRVFFVAVRRDVDVRELGYAQRDGLDATEVTRGSAKSNGESRMCEHKGSGVSSGFVHGELSNTDCTGLQTQRSKQQTTGTTGSNSELADGDALWEPQSQGCVGDISGRNSNLSDEELAHSQSVLLQGCADGQGEEQSGGSNPQLPNANLPRLQGCECSRGTNASGWEIPHGHPSKCSNPSVTERVLGKGFLQWGWEYPRTYSDPEEAIKSLMGDAVDGLDPEHVRTHREDMLRMLGNGVVPDTAEIAIRLCLEELLNNQLT